MEKNEKNVSVNQNQLEQAKNFWCEYKWLIFLQLGIVLSFILTQIFFNDFSDGSKIFTLVWLGFALIIDFTKGQSGGICLEAITQIKTFKENKSSKLTVILLSGIIYFLTLNISWNASIAAQLLFNQDKRIKNYTTSGTSKKIEELENTKAEKEKSLKDMTETLSKAIEKDSELSSEQVKARDGINNSIQNEKEKIAGYDRRITIAIQNKKGHATLDRRKEYAQQEIERLQGNLKDINVNIKSGQEDINKQSKLLRDDIERLDDDIKALESGKSKVSSKTEKKTGIQLLFKNNDDGIKDYMKFIAGVIEFAIVYFSFMWQRQRRLSKKGNDIVVDDSPKQTLEPNTALSTNEIWTPESKTILGNTVDIFKNNILKPRVHEQKNKHEIIPDQEQKIDIKHQEPEKVEIKKDSKKIDFQIENILDNVDEVDFEDARIYLVTMFENQKIEGQSPSIADMTSLLKGKIVPKYGQKHSEYVRTIRGMLTKKGILKSISDKNPQNNKTLILKSREELKI